MRRAGIVTIALLLGLGWAFHERHWWMIQALALAGPPALLAASDEGPGVRWYDDYFTVQAIDERTFALGEPRFAQQNFSYLILGSERALLFDAGPGLRDLRPLVRSLTDLPVTFVPSHFHYDHVGNTVTFERVAVVDLPYLRARAPDGRLALTFGEHLGAAERIEAPTLEVDEWLAPGSAIELGGRTLRVLHTPGHTEDSISLLDVRAGVLFSGDFLYPGELYAFLPGSGLGDYLQATETVLAHARAGTTVHGAHRVAPPGAPRQPLDDVADLGDALRAVRAGELEGTGFYPVSYPVNARVSLLAEPGWLQDWTPRHPTP